MYRHAMKISESTAIEEIKVKTYDEADIRNAAIHISILSLLCKDADS